MINYSYLLMAFGASLRQDLAMRKPDRTLDWLLLIALAGLVLALIYG